MVEGKEILQKILFVPELLLLHCGSQGVFVWRKNSMRMYHGSSTQMRVKLGKLMLNVAPELINMVGIHKNKRKVFQVANPPIAIPESGAVDPRVLAQNSALAAGTDRWR